MDAIKRSVLNHPLVLFGAVSAILVVLADKVLIFPTAVVVWILLFRFLRKRIPVLFLRLIRSPSAVALMSTMRDNMDSFPVIPVLVVIDAIAIVTVIAPASVPVGAIAVHSATTKIKKIGTRNRTDFF